MADTCVSRVPVFAGPSDDPLGVTVLPVAARVACSPSTIRETPNPMVIGISQLRRGSGVEPNRVFMNGA